MSVSWATFGDLEAYELLESAQQTPCGPHDFVAEARDAGDYILKLAERIKYERACMLADMQNEARVIPPPRPDAGEEAETRRCQ
jgi:hypothetical protein